VRDRITIFYVYFHLRFMCVIMFFMLSLCCVIKLQLIYVYFHLRLVCVLEPNN
jgi:hypothetical protein